MTELLLADDSDLSDREQLVLARFINSCVKKASGKVICPKTKQDPEKKDKKVCYSIPAGYYSVSG